MRHAAKKTYPCYRLSSPVTLDGRLDEPAWQALPEATGYLLLKTPYYSHERQTGFRIGWDDTGLYLGFRCHEPAAAELAALPAEQRGGWGGEIVELFFMRERPIYRQFAVDVNGTLQHAFKYKGDMFHPTELSHDGIQAAGHIGTDEWTLEVKLPFSALDGQPKDGESWHFNFTRDSALGNRKTHELLTTWSYSDTHFHDYNTYSTLRFYGSTLIPRQAEQLAATVNADYRAFLAARGGVDKQRAALQATMDAATPVQWPGDLQGLSATNPRPPLWDDNRGYRYYGALPVSWEWSGATPLTFNACRIAWFGPTKMPQDYGLEYWDGTNWQLAFHDENNSDMVTLKRFAPVTTTRVRLTVFSAQPDYETMRVRAFDLYNLSERQAGN